LELMGLVNVAASSSLDRSPDILAGLNGVGPLLSSSAAGKLSVILWATLNILLIATLFAIVMINILS